MAKKSSKSASQLQTSTLTFATETCWNLLSLQSTATKNSVAWTSSQQWPQQPTAAASVDLPKSLNGKLVLHVSMKNIKKEIAKKRQMILVAYVYFHPKAQALSPSSPSRSAPPPGRRSGPRQGCRWHGQSVRRSPWRPGNSQIHSAIRGDVAGWEGWIEGGGCRRKGREEWGGRQGSEVKQARQSHWGMTNPVCTQNHFSLQTALWVKAQASN